MKDHSSLYGLMMFSQNRDEQKKQGKVSLRMKSGSKKEYLAPTQI